MRNLLFICCLINITAFGQNQILPDAITAMPILIEIPDSNKTIAHYGSGIFLQESNKLYLVTAAHCIFNVLSTNRSELINSNANLYIPIMLSDRKCIFSVDMDVLNKAGLIKRHPTHDVAVMMVAVIDEETNNMSMSHYANALELKSPMQKGDILWQSSINDNCVLFTNVPDGNETYILGYPVELINPSIFSEVDYNVPLVRKGIVSQKNRSTKKLIIDSGVYGGNSGGPILITQMTGLGTETFKIVGLMTEFVPQTTRMFPQGGITNNILLNSGYSVAEPIDFAIELMRQF